MVGRLPVGRCSSALLQFVEVSAARLSRQAVGCQGNNRPADDRLLRGAAVAIARSMWLSTVRTNSVSRSAALAHPVRGKSREPPADPQGVVGATARSHLLADV